MRIRNLVPALLIAFAVSVPCISSASVIITEINSKSEPVDDFFELTNTGASSVDITGWKYSDSHELADAVSLTLDGFSSIEPGESVVFFKGEAADVAGFKTAWGGLAGVKVGYHDGKGLGKNDALNVYDNADMLIATQSYSSGDDNNKFHAGNWVGGNENDSAIWVPGTTSSIEYVAAASGVYGSFLGAGTGIGDGGWGSPGYASVPEPSSILLVVLGSFFAAVFARRRFAK